MNHTDCGAYGEAGVREMLITDLRKAADVLSSASAKIPVEIKACLANVSERDGVWKVELEEIDF